MDLRRNYSFLVILVALLASAWVGAAQNDPTPQVSKGEFSFTFFMHDNLLTDDPSAYFLTLPVVTADYRTFFGALVVFDDLITAGPDPNSTELGRGRGFYLFDASDSNFNGIEFVWTAEFVENFGTLSFAGFDRNPDQTKEISVVGGTGQLPSAKEYADITTCSLAGGAASQFILLLT